MNICRGRVLTYNIYAYLQGSNICRGRVLTYNIYGLTVGWALFICPVMARPLRIDIADGWYHCMNRGLERRNIFADAKDQAHFLTLLGEVVDRFRFRIHAYCLMDNHYHALIQTPDANLSQGMQWLGLSYSTWFNTRHRRVGPLFQGRFKGLPVEEGAYALDLSLYIHLNPVMRMSLGLDKRRKKSEALGVSSAPEKELVTVRLKELREYRWSSYRSYAGYESGVDWLCRDEILRRSAKAKDERQSKYRERVQETLRRGVDESELEQFRGAVGIGTESFKQRMRALADGGYRETEHRGRLRETRSYEEVVAVVAQHRGEPAAEWLERHGDWGKWLVAILSREYTGMTLGEIGLKMGGSDYAAIGMGLRRFEQRLKKERSLMTTYKQLSQMLYVKTRP
mgnify:CR=1 FL=1